MAFVPVSTEQSVSVEEHVARILEAVEPLPPYDQPLLEALGLPVCEEVASPMDLPSFDNSGMDGYAVVTEDVTTGDVILSDGAVLGPRQVGVLASVGRAQVRSRPRPRVVVLSTGSELRSPGNKLSHDAIYDANSFMLAAAIRRAGAIAFRVGIVSDDPTEFADALSDQLVRADVVVTSGGASQGRYDVVPAGLGDPGTVWFGG